MPRYSAETADRTAKVLCMTGHIFTLLTAHAGDRRLNQTANMADSAVYRALRLYVLFTQLNTFPVLFLCSYTFGISLC